jgi:hypothetical protein
MFIGYMLVALLISCTSNKHEEIPEIIKEIKERRQDSLLSLTISDYDVSQDTVLIKIYIDSKKNRTDTLFHSSSYPAIISYIGKNELSRPFEDQIVFHDLARTIVPSGSQILIHEWKMLKRAEPYNIIAIFNYTQRDEMYTEDYWMVSNSISILGK